MASGFALSAAVLAWLLTAQAVSTEVIVPRYCITEIKAGPEFECRGDDMRHLNCKGLEVTVISGCEIVHVKEK